MYFCLCSATLSTTELVFSCCEYNLKTEDWPSGFQGSPRPFTRATTLLWYYFQPLTIFKVLSLLYKHFLKQGWGATVVFGGLSFSFVIPDVQCCLFSNAFYRRLIRGDDGHLSLHRIPSIAKIVDVTIKFFLQPNLLLYTNYRTSFSTPFSSSMWLITPIPSIV